MFEEEKLHRLDHQQTEDRYLRVRELVYERIMKKWSVTAAGISFHDCVTADKWKALTGPNVRETRASWWWAEQFSVYQNQPNRFEITLSNCGQLGALCYGRTSRAGRNTRLDLIEAIPLKPSPLNTRAVPIIVQAGVMFADLVGASEIWIIDPDPKLEGLYSQEQFGGREPYHKGRIGQRRIL
ncbi:MAG: hypothetical protein HY308_00575 [Gammaproteobacteria bacterium]|nr:hypothetical protein [Gammaproteobacteria bacterium]